MAKKYYWLKLKNDFFNQKCVKKLRKIAGGDTYTIIYLKIQLLTLKDNAKLFYENTEDSIYEQLALELDESIENIKVTFMFLERHGLIERASSNEYLLTETAQNIGKESEAAERVRRFRKKSEQEALHCNAHVTKCNTEIEKELDKDKDSSTNVLLVDESSSTSPERKNIEKKQNKIPPCPHQKIIDLYHEMLPMCPRIIEWTETRQANLRARWRKYPTLGHFKSFFQKVADSKFLTGRAKNYRGKPFTASLGWLVKSENFTNTIEGKYDNE